MKQAPHYTLRAEQVGVRVITPVVKRGRNRWQETLLIGW